MYNCLTTAPARRPHHESIHPLGPIQPLSFLDPHRGAARRPRSLLGAWKYSAIRGAEAASANQPEPTETVAAAVATARPHQETASAIGTVLAPRSITLRNEVTGTVHFVSLQPGQVVNAGAVLVALDVSVETAELRAQEAQARLAQTSFERVER